MKLRDKLYTKPDSKHLLEYEVIYIKKLKGQTVYGLDCLSCNHSPGCRIEVKIHRQVIIFHSMLNEKIEISWHRHEIFHLRKEDAVIEYLRKAIVEAYNHIIKHQDLIITERDLISQADAKIEIIKRQGLTEVKCPKCGTTPIISVNGG